MEVRPLWRAIAEVIPKFHPGDAVWAKLMVGREVPAEVRGWGVPCPNGEPHAMYEIEGGPYGVGLCCEPFMRPRRDDYQQREGLGSRERLQTPLADPEAVPAELLAEPA